MEHAYSTHQTPVSPWRTAAIVAAAVAAVELFVLIIVGVIFGAKLVTDSTARTVVAAAQATKPAAATESVTTETPKTKQEHKPQPTAELPRNRTSVIVLNGNGISGAAAATADSVRRFHYMIAATGNAPRTDFRNSFIMYRPGFKAEGLRLAKDMHLRRAVPLDGITKRDLQGAHLALILGG